MKNYDEACALYYSKLNVKCLPLISWEFKINDFSDAILFRRFQSKWNTQNDYLKQAEIEDREVIITDKNFKIVFASKSISKISGYQQEEILGKSPKMFQGKDTCLTTTQKIKTALIQLKPFKEVVLNYKKNGEIYWCEIEGIPMFDQKGKFLNYVALEKIAS